MTSSLIPAKMEAISFIKLDLMDVAMKFDGVNEAGSWDLGK